MNNSGYSLLFRADTHYLNDLKSNTTTIHYNDKKRKHNPFYFILFVIGLFLAVLLYNTIDANSSKTRFDSLVQKIKSNKPLTDTEWSELCKLLPEVKGIYVADCDDCRNYVIALLEGKHHRFLVDYQKKRNVELEKGIRSIEKQINLHIDKINNPQKHISQWNDLRSEQKKNLIEKKWNEDILRQREQKEILECILKNK